MARLCGCYVERYYFCALLALGHIPDGANSAIAPPWFGSQLRLTGAKTKKYTAAMSASTEIMSAFVFVIREL